ncbi:hypothetical protein FJZ55_10010, partial [Candidatus Woesearchaeota archaeon]|nr:hypothetical protein [Candidatus Woesearchaeota archaeon]
MKTLVRFCLNALALASLAVDAADFTLTATPADGQITLNWPAVAGAKAYSLCQARDVISDVDQCTLYPGGRWLDRTRPGYQATGLTNDTAYSFRVVAFNTRDILGISNVVTVKPGLAPPAPIASGSLNDTGITAAQCYGAGSDTLID